MRALTDLDPGVPTVRRVVELPVCYGGELGPDLDDVARHAGLSAGEVVALHSGRAYRIDMLGFLPGFAYCTGMDPRLATPRLAVPRTRIPAGSVGIAGEQTGVYPLASPGGWNLIGRTPARVYDPGRADPIPYRAGDWLRFVPVDRAVFDGLAGRVAGGGGRRARARGALRGRRCLWCVRRRVRSGAASRSCVPGCATRCRTGAASATRRSASRRPGRWTGGRRRSRTCSWATPRALRCSNARSRAPFCGFDRPAVVCVAGATTDARLDGAPLEPYAAHAVAAGQTLDVGRASWGAYAYLAVAGGIDVPAAMGSRSTSCAYGLGGFEGRALRAGDVLPLAADAPAALPGIAARRLASCDAYFRRDADPTSPTWVRVVPAADEARLGAGWLRSFYRDPFRATPRSDRMGLRLAPCGEAVPPEAPDLVSEGVVLGCVQVPASGEPIVVLADHQTTGGYAKAGVVAGVDLPRLAQLRPGQTVRFERVGVEEAQRLAREEARFLEGLRAGVERAAARAARA